MKKDDDLIIRDRIVNAPVGLLLLQAATCGQKLEKFLALIKASRSMIVNITSIVQLFVLIYHTFVYHSTSRNVQYLSGTSWSDV